MSVTRPCHVDMFRAAGAGQLPKFLLSRRKSHVGFDRTGDSEARHAVALAANERLESRVHRIAPFVLIHPRLL
jgi:hypothetical protein